jgi:hypothetical protein
MGKAVPRYRTPKIAARSAEDPDTGPDTGSIEVIEIVFPLNRGYFVVKEYASNSGELEHDG